MKFAVIIFLLFIQSALCAEFGEYKYSKYVGIQQQLQYQRARAINQQRRYQQILTRNIRYPSANNSYPNIQRRPYQISRTQRYSAQYYKNYY